ncbi:hypothetical protein BTM25_02880 [Actinomadura rubteroloni]|uniref:Alpha/beta hydrolase n=1 Tax=Actinomadura rubteroloni TaxID=1926885 RepID=A0A2P4ULH7_9ACTN|nr:hypothetical protein BTM25_02880 [Actinomadura rubteroloni]
MRDVTPGTVVLLHAPSATAAVWADVPETLRTVGHDVVAPTVAGAPGPPYVARAALILAATDPASPLLLVGQGAAGPLLPALARAQRAAHRTVGGYLFVDASLPTADRAHGALPEDWPDAPCGYLRTHADRTSDTTTSTAAAREQAVRESRLRGWPVHEQHPPTTIVQALTSLITTL